MHLRLIIFILLYTSFSYYGNAQYKIEISSTDVTSSNNGSVFSSSVEYRIVGGAGQPAISVYGGFFRSVQGSGFVNYVNSDNPVLPGSFLLSQNYPNPFNPTTTIKYQIANDGFVTLKVYDILGNEVTTLVNEEKKQGKYEVSFDASLLASGVYFYKLHAGNFIEAKKMILLK